MRFSHHSKSSQKAGYSSSTTHQKLLDAFGKTKSESLSGALLLVGGRDYRSLVVRGAQSSLRYDRRSSYWSHAAIITTWNPTHPERSVGLEVALDPSDSVAQVPERNGVTAFALRKYLDARVYPNMALVHVALKNIPGEQDGKKIVAQSGQERRDAVLAAAKNPCSQRETFRLWEGLGAWSRYSFTPELVPNPLLENVPHPGASFCEYAYAAAEVDLVPGASTSHTCPELIWASVKHWQNTIDSAGSTLHAHVLVGDEHGQPLDALSMTLKG